MMEEKIGRLLRRFDQVEKDLADPQILTDQERYKALAQEHSYLLGIQNAWKKIQKAKQSLEEDKVLLKEETDEEMLTLLKEEIDTLDQKIIVTKKELESLLVPPDPNDDRNIIVELRAGTGGDEATLFVADCVRMYQLFADQKNWKYELLSSSASDLGGFKEYIMVLSGPQVNRYMQYEGGTHRVQRVPTTETQGRVHTSAITIAVLIEPKEEEGVEINEKDLKIDTYRASGAGGQHVNVTDSAVRITHLPTGVVTYCQEERSQHKNKDKAMRLLKAKIAQAEAEKKHKEEAEKRASQVGSGDRSERIRTYNFPQNRVTDHRIGLTLYHLDEILKGDLEEISASLIQFYHQQKLSQ